MDRLFTALVALSLVAHGGFVAYLNNADWPAQQGWEYVPRDVIDFVVTPLPAAAAIAPAPRPTDTQTNATDPIPADDGAAVPAPHRPNRPTRPAPSGDPRPDVRLAPDLSRVGINAVLASLGDGPGSVAADMLRGGHVDADLDDALAQVRGVQAPVGGRPTQLRPRDGGVAGPVRPVGQIDQQIVADQVIQTGDRDEQPVHGIARPGAPPDPIGGTGTLRVLDVRRVVNQALGGIQRCYERQLRNNPTLRGRVSVTFTVTGSGRVSGARAASSFDPTVGTCVASVVSRLRFPEPEGGAVAFAFPFVFEPGQR